ncbi:MAG: dethiobiotin synthase [Caulobacteraceae bacterium]
MSAVFITGAGTDIGKTYASAALVRARRAAGRQVTALKPVASGLPREISDPAFSRSDTATLLAAQGLETTPETVAACSPWRFEAPLSPDMAARAEGRVLQLAEVIGWCETRLAAAPAGTDVLIEGVGGVMSPVAEDGLVLDWILALGVPTLVVCGSYLGAISHALTAVEALQARGAPVAGLILNESENATVDFEAVAETLHRFGRLPVTSLRRGAALAAGVWPD